jgi:hypothetical protein
MQRALALFAATVLLLAAGPVDAHVGGAERAAFEAPELLPIAQHAGAAQLFVAGDASDLSWPLAVIAALAATLLIRRRSRRLFAAILVLLIAVLGVEVAVHSVHHGGQPVACPTASIAAHLHGTTVVALALDQPLHPIGAAAVQADPLLTSLRSLDASQPRAPPFALA